MQVCSITVYKSTLYYTTNTILFIAQYHHHIYYTRRETKTNVFYVRVCILLDTLKNFCAFKMHDRRHLGAKPPATGQVLQYHGENCHLNLI